MAMSSSVGASSPDLFHVAADGRVTPTKDLLSRAPAIVRHHLSSLPVHRAMIRVVEALLLQWVSPHRWASSYFALAPQENVTRFHMQES